MSIVPFRSSGTADVSTLSADAAAMQKPLKLIADVRAGAAKIREAGETYLPKFEAESVAEYKRRLACAPWRPEFVDLLAQLVAKPFSKPVTVAEDASPEVKTWAENIDGLGNSLHVFARRVFENAVADGFTLVRPSYGQAAFRTQADEKAADPTPWLVNVRAKDVIALRSEFRDGKERFIHARFRECVTVQDGEYGEKEIEQIRELTPTTFKLWQRPNDGGAWAVVESGEISIANAELRGIPLAILFTGERTGTARCKPPLLDIADLQLELYRALSRRDDVMVYSSSPMLCGIGVTPPKDSHQEVGPRVVLYAPPAGEGKTDWKFVEPNAENIRAIREDTESIVSDMRRLGMAPMTAKSGNITATATSVETAKAHSVLESWAIGLRDALELAIQAMTLFARDSRTVRDAAVTVNISTDFGVGLQGAEELKAVLLAQKDGVISKRTTREEMQRRGALGPQFVEDEEEQRLAEEADGLEPEEPFNPRNGATALELVHAS